VTDNWLTVPQVAEKLQIGRERAYQLVKEGEIPAKKVGEPRRIRVSERLLHEWVDSHEDVATGPRTKGG
jgi:excisionase family DNA binding protein